ncbi:MAG TPA: histidine phosphatase family protein [Mycobacteriales bacterium]|nr:histidine phosphatase family protein [Mycobacteriales bacterium]
MTRPARGPDTAARAPDSGHDPRRLVLVRHAKAAPDGGADADRPLADRGVADAAAIGRWLADHGLAPDRVVVSPARRARQTWELAAGEIGAAPEPVLDERMYDNTLDDLLAVLRGTPPEADTLVLVGHNPAIEALALTLDDGRGDATARGELRRKYPTSGVGVFAVTTDWPRVAAGTGTLTAFAVPRG